MSHVVLHGHIRLSSITAGLSRSRVQRADSLILFQATLFKSAMHHRKQGISTKYNIHGLIKVSMGFSNPSPLEYSGYILQTLAHS